MNILLHFCCGPCAIYPLRALLEQGHEVTGLFYNPNIHPLQEYLRRRGSAREVGERFGIRMIFLDREYDPQAYMRRVAFRENSRCLLCYQVRLERTLSIARRGKFQGFSSTLLYSKQQQHQVIAKLGADLAGDGRVGFVYQDFRLGWQEGIQQSLEWELYRQDYCGCLYSEFERFQERLQEVNEKRSPESQTE
ncbi:MAG: epoxyqueuosine reductase QueH [Desulfohalobiaceae bacterium]|nr:epoxyqueuosine reductase QueH [Desulfohalobiaceae bacterium]